MQCPVIFASDGSLCDYAGPTPATKVSIVRTDTGFGSALFHLVPFVLIGHHGRAAVREDNMVHLGGIDKIFVGIARRTGCRTANLSPLATEDFFAFPVGQSCRSALNSWAAPDSESGRPTATNFVLDPTARNAAGMRRCKEPTVGPRPGQRRTTTFQRQDAKTQRGKPQPKRRV